jgi:hypothetical protein
MVTHLRLVKKNNSALNTGHSEKESNMTTIEMLNQVGGLGGLRQIVLRRHPNPGDEYGELPRQRREFERYLETIEYSAAMKDVDADTFLRRPSNESELRELLTLAGVLTVDSYESRTGKRRYGDD